MFDPERYRSKDEVQAWRARDPVATFAARMEAAGVLAAGDRARLEAEAKAEVDDAVAFAEAGTLEPVEELTRFVYAEPSQ
jgi:pyruvate dehydrogenase E1 component alpha subunit